MRQRATLRYDQTLFCAREVFEFTCMPDEVHHRDAQIRELALLPRPTLQGDSPKSAILRGPPGTGKTITVYINCQQHRTPFAVFACIFEAVVGYTPRRPASTSTRPCGWRRRSRRTSRSSGYDGL